MKKLFLMMGLASFFMVACNNAPKQEQPKEEPQAEVVAPAEEHHCPFCSLKAEYANWETMEEAAKVELNEKAIAQPMQKMKKGYTRSVGVHPFHPA